LRRNGARSLRTACAGHLGDVARGRGLGASRTAQRRPASQASAQRFEAAESPFDYPRQAEVLIVTDIKRGDMGALAAPMPG
jgi:hypothetical protein